MSMGIERNGTKMDYEALFENALKKMKNYLDTEKEYFECLSRLGTYSNDIDIVSKHLMKMSMSDQLKVIKAVIIQGEISKILREKYRFEEDTE